MNLTHSCVLTMYSTTNPQPGSRLAPQYRELDNIAYNISAKAYELLKKPGMDEGYRQVSVEYHIGVSGASMDVSVWYQGTKIGGKNVDISLD